MDIKTILIILLIVIFLLIIYKLKIVEFFDNQSDQTDSDLTESKSKDSNEQDEDKKQKHKQIIDKYKNKQKKVEEIKKATNETIDLFYSEKPLEIYYDVFEYSDPWSDRMDIEKKNKD